LTQPDSSPTLKQIASTFRLTGWISFWSQLVLTIVSGAILLFAPIASRGDQSVNNPGTNVGVVLTVCGIAALGFNMYWAVFRYIPIGRRLQGAASTRPKKADAIQVLKTGLIALSQGAAGFINTDQSKFIKPLDILVVQASINVILAHFVAIATSLWLLNKMSRQ
jgi:hypothetical protein